MSQMPFFGDQTPHKVNSAPYAHQFGGDETKSSIRSLCDLQNLVKARGGTTEITAICEKTIRGDTSTFATETGKLEFSSWNNTRMRGVVTKDHYSIGIFLNSDPTNTLLNKELSSGNIVFMKPNAEREAAYVKPMEGAFVHVQAGHLERLLAERGFSGGTENLPSALQTSLPPALAKFIVSSIMRIRDELQRQSSENTIPERAFSYAYDHFLDNMLDCLAVSADASYQARDADVDAHKLLKRIEELMLERPGDMLTLNQLCDHFNVSRPAVRKAFTDTLGVTPCVYMRNWRLSRAREGLQQGHFRNVTDAAMHWGFFDCGRFSGYYSQHFGELPSATLKQAQLPNLG